MRFKNYRNKYNNQNRIYSQDDVMNMTLGSIFDNENDILAQNREIGVPTTEELQNSPNAVWIEAYTRDDGTEVRGHWRSLPDCSSSPLASKQEGTLTGGAAKVERSKEGISLEQNNDEYFDKMRKHSVLMHKNGEMNKDRPDAKLFMDIALAGPKQVPSTNDYHFISSDNVEKLNADLNLVGNKEIPKHYDGFVFSANSPTAQRLNASDELKREIFSEKNFDKEKGCFKCDKLEIELKDDTNLNYSFGHMTILNPKITKDGYVTGLVYDKYNFEPHYYDLKYKTMLFNNLAKGLQSIGRLKNYFILVPIKIKI